MNTMTPEEKRQGEKDAARREALIEFLWKLPEDTIVDLDRFGDSGELMDEADDK